MHPSRYARVLPKEGRRSAGTVSVEVVHVLLAPRRVIRLRFDLVLPYVTPSLDGLRWTAKSNACSRDCRENCRCFRRFGRHGDSSCGVACNSRLGDRVGGVSSHGGAESSTYFVESRHCVASTSIEAVSAEAVVSVASSTRIA